MRSTGAVGSAAWYAATNCQTYGLCSLTCIVFEFWSCGYTVRSIRRARGERTQNQLQRTKIRYGLDWPPLSLGRVAEKHFFSVFNFTTQLKQRRSSWGLLFDHYAGSLYIPAFAFNGLIVLQNANRPLVIFYGRWRRCYRGKPIPHQCWCRPTLGILVGNPRSPWVRTCRGVVPYSERWKQSRPFPIQRHSTLGDPFHP
jgi:hypothetical protein